MRHLRNIIMDKRAIDEWAKNVPLVQRILNSMIHSSTGVRPSSIIYSEEIDPSIIRSRRSTPNADEIETTDPTTEEESSSLIEWEQTWLDRLKESQKYFIEKAVQSLSEMDDKRRIKSPKITTDLDIGSFVLCEQGSSFRRGPNSKLLPLLAGPFEIIAHIHVKKCNNE
jgi:hypothetical protein